MPNQLATLRSIYKHATRVESPGEASLSVALAFQAMHAGRPGPAAIEMPWDIFTQTAELASPLVLPPLPPPPVDTERVQEAARLIAASRAPMIFVGSGAAGAADEILAPGGATSSARCSLSQRSGYRKQRARAGVDDRRSLPALAGHRRRDWHWYPARGPSVALVEPPQRTRRLFASTLTRPRCVAVHPDVGIVADAREATLALIAALEREKSAARDRLPAIRRARERPRSRSAISNPRSATWKPSVAPCPPRAS